MLSSSFGMKPNPVAPPVLTTGVPLSERFKSVPGHNPFRPNPGTGTSHGVRRATVSFGADLVDDDDEPRTFRNTRGVALGNGGGGVNKLAVLRALKDAEILRLKAQVRHLKLRLSVAIRQAGGGLGLGEGMSGFSRNRRGLRNRGGGGFIFGSGRKYVNLTSTRSLKFLQPGGARRNNGVSPLNAKSSKGKTNLNFFGEPKTKEDLDDELDAYMSKSKTKVRSDLDKELDEYMIKARAQSFAGKVGLIPVTVSSTPETAPVEIVEDVTMAEADADA